MIGYRVTKKQLESLINKAAPGWLANAAIRTAKFRKIGYYEETSSNWSKVKAVYMLLQGDCKCAYCEQKLESTDFGKVAQDVEHFRPKGNVRAWKLSKALKDEGIKVTNVPSGGGGYYLLPYHPLNYSAACKPCNSVLKKDYFPIAGKYNLKGDDPTKLTKENPLLIYPIGDFDDASENLISFYGVSPRAVATKGHKRNRALVTIEFFKLDDETKRKNLFLERASVIVALYPQMEKQIGGATAREKAIAKKLVDSFTSPKAKHTNCAMSFKKLFQQNRAEAKDLYEAAADLIASSS